MNAFASGNLMHNGGGLMEHILNFFASRSIHIKSVLPQPNFSAMRKPKFIFILFIVTGFFSCSKFEEIQEKKLDASKQQTLWEIKYGNHTRNTLNIALPANRTSNTPVVIFIHGGAWMFGDKNVHVPEIEKFAKAGIACATINYRFASQITGTHHPALPNDVKAAVDFIASKASLWGVSANRFGLVGQSAGGHLALLTSYTLNTDNRIKACASWAGVVNLLDDDQMKVTGGELVGQTYMGFSLNTHSDTLRYREASPYFMASPNSVPTFLLHGTKDIAVPYSSVLNMQQHLNELGVDNRLKVFEGGGHLWFGKDLETARTLTIDWFREKL